MIQNITPRKYQKEIVETCKKKSCLVVLPTGIGKTLIALMLTTDILEKNPKSKILFLAPTRPLAQHHLNYFTKHLPELYADMQLFTGKIDSEKRKKIWQTADIIFSTPQCISNDLKNNLYNLSEVSLLVEDECHRCVKNYSYTYVAQKYKEQSDNFHVLGLTASPGADKKSIKKICENLNIEDVELRTRESDDVKEYLQELEIQTIKLDFPKEFLEIYSMIQRIYQTKVDELKKRNLLFGPANKVTLLKAQATIMKAISSGNKNFNLLLGASACALAIKLQHLSELLETQTLETTNEYIKELFKQAEQKKSKAVQRLAKMPEFNLASIKLNNLISNNIEHPKLIVLKDLVETEYENNNKTKLIIFAQFRNTISQIANYLNKIKGINAKVFVGQAKKIIHKKESGLNQKQQQEIIKEFSEGKINVLCATSIAEEGLDIPEVNSVVFYEPIPSAIRSIQRRGRTARLIKGKLIMLITKKTRDEAYYWSAFHKEKRMHSAIDSIKKEFQNGTFKTNKNSDINQQTLD